MKKLLILTIGVLLAMPPAAAAHQLDEYLQATRLALAPHRVAVEIALTPGVSVAPRVIALIDTNGDGEVSASECETYAHQVLKDVVLRLDGERRSLALAGARFPSLEEMGAGVGTIRLQAEADAPPGVPGRHELVYRNDHQPGVGVYLVNALVPATEEIAITGQRRDALQHGIRLEYTVASGAARRLPWLIVASFVLSTLVVSRRRR